MNGWGGDCMCMIWRTDKNWDIESHWRFVANGILWAAKVEVPNAGTKEDFSPADLNRNLDDKRPKPDQKPPGK